jgi:hypothetical protein
MVAGVCGGGCGRSPVEGRVGRFEPLAHLRRLHHGYGLPSIRLIIVLAEDLLALLEPGVVQHEAFDDEFPQRFCGPDAKLRGLIAVHPVAHGDDGVQVVVFGPVFLPSEAVCSKMELTESSFSSPVLKMFCRCLVTAGLSYFGHPARRIGRKIPKASNNQH